MAEAPIDRAVDAPSSRDPWCALAMLVERLVIAWGRMRRKFGFVSMLPTLSEAIHSLAARGSIYADALCIVPYCTFSVRGIFCDASCPELIKCPVRRTLLVC